MSNKLFERIEDYVLVDGDMPLEDPNALSNIFTSLQVVEHLNWLAKDALLKEQKIDSLNAVIAGLESAIINGELTPSLREAYRLATKVVLNGTGLQMEYACMEGIFGEDTLHSVSADIESIKEKISSLIDIVKDKWKNVIVANYQHLKKIMSTAGNILNKAEKNLQRISEGNYTETKKSPTLDITELESFFIGNGEALTLKQNIQTATNLLHNHSLMSSGIDIFVELFNEVKSIDTSTKEALEKSATELEQNQKEKLNKLIISKGYKLTDDSSDKSERYHLIFDSAKNFHSLINIDYGKNGIITSIGDAHGIYYLNGKDVDDYIHDAKKKSVVAKTIGLSDCKDVSNYVSEMMKAAWKVEKEFGDNKSIEDKFINEIRRVEAAIAEYYPNGHRPAPVEAVFKYTLSAPLYSILLFKPIKDVLEYSVELGRTVNAFVSKNIDNLEKD